MTRRSMVIEHHDVGIERALGLSRGRRREVVSRFADDALASFLKIIVDIHNENEYGLLAKYRTDARIRERFPDGYSVKMGFGLHIGWAIEGAIGSQYKIDASYLSPHVNLASRLEAATKQYGVPLLLSADFAQELSEDAQRYLRLIDRVTVKGSAHPLELYTFDISNIPTSFGELAENLRPRNREQAERNKTSLEKHINIDFATDPAVLALQEGLPDEFFYLFERGVQAYLDGRWGEAREVLTRVLTDFKKDDGPTLVLLRVMEEEGVDGESPPDWPGYRKLTEK